MHMKKEKPESVSRSVMLAFCNPMYCSPLGSLSMDFPGKNTTVAIPFSRGLPEPRVKPGFPVLQADSLPSEPPGNVHGTIIFTLIAESEEEIRSLLLRVKEESEKAALKLNIQKTKIMASSPITSWQTDMKKVEMVTDFVSLGSKNTAE